MKKFNIEKLIQELVTNLKIGKPVRKKLPGKGMLHIDRRLPFLFVYRQPTQSEDQDTERLIRAEAAFLIAPGEHDHHDWLEELIFKIAETFSDDFGAFILVEISSMVGKLEEGFDEDWHPSFKINIPESGPSNETIDALEAQLKKVKIFNKLSKVEVSRNSVAKPKNMLPLLSSDKLQSLNCFSLGLEILPIFRDEESGVFPLAIRALRRQLSKALKRSVHAFCLSNTRLTPASYLSFGQRKLSKAVLDVDHRLGEISESFNFLLNVTPVNVDSAWKEFKEGGFENDPKFIYRPLPVDPALFKRKLFGIPIEKIADPALEQLFRDKQLEIDRKLTMFLDRGTQRFLFGSQQLFGPIPSQLVKLAKIILKKFPDNKSDEEIPRFVHSKELFEKAEIELQYYRNLDSEFTSSVEIREDVFSIMVAQGEFLIGKNSKINASRVDAILQHEIGTHVLTFFNGKCQPLRILRDGLAGYDELQEGLAVLSEYLVGGLTVKRLRTLSARVVAVRNLIDGLTFTETFHDLTSQYQFGKEQAFNITMRVYRGGGLTKDAVYLRGLVGILEYLRKDQDLESLLIGKIATPYLSVIHELSARKVLNPPRLRPRYFEDQEAQSRLDQVKNTTSVLSLAEELPTVGRMSR